MPVASPRRLVLASLVAAVLRPRRVLGHACARLGRTARVCRLTARTRTATGSPTQFETERILDPYAVDSDGDGLQDPAEDLDTTGSATSRNRSSERSRDIADTDGDGTLDGETTPTDDGTPDWVEQDARPYPIT